MQRKINMAKVVIFMLTLYFVPFEVSSQCRQFDGTDDMIESTNANYKPLSAWWKEDKDQLTVECWIYLDEIDRRNLGVFAQVFNTEFAVGIDDEAGFDNKMRSFLLGTSPGGWFYSNGISFAANRWYHIALVYDGQARIHYINGEIDGSTQSETGSTTGQAGSARIISGAYIAFYKGKIDELRVWSYGRSQAQIKSNMYKVVGDKEPGLELYWNFDKKAGTVIDHTKQGADTNITIGTLTQPNVPIKRVVGD